MLKRILFLFFALVTGAIAYTQVTSSNITGNITSDKGEALVGATVKVTHVPTGTVYIAQTRTDGAYTIVNMIPGGPYKVETSFVGFNNDTQSDIQLPLGETVRVDASLISNQKSLTEVVVTATPTARRKTGASFSISKDQIAAIPTLSRSLQDYTRLTPQANGNSFGGINNRFNNITIDGAVNNDVFGLAASGTPGGQASTTPISLDAIQEIQVVLAPYDITYGNFTGGGVNAVTRSGTNNYEGSAYYFFRNQGTVGKDPVSRIKTATFSDKQYGIRIGGPIVKNKLFFFANGELGRRTAPTIFNAGETGALLTTDEAQQLSTFVKTNYNYDAGTFNGFDAETQSDKLFGRIDWNINTKHRLTIRHNYIKAYDDNISRSGILFRYGNNTYRFNNKQNITVAELRSRFNGTFSNDLIIGRHRIRDYRTTYGTLFPSIEISKGAGTIQLGSERSSTANELDQDIFEITDNLKIFTGKNTFTVGTHNEFFKFRNLFINNFNGRWRFASLTDFFDDFPRQFDVTYSGNKSADVRPSAAFKAAQLGFYVQDEIQLSRNFRLTAGIRVDVPVIGTDPAYNKIVDSTFNGAYSTSNTPNGQLLYSPRVGFNYDVEGNRKTIVRGGIGIFSGRLPFVWLSNQFGNTGLLLKTTSQTDNTPTAAPFTVNNGNGFNPNPNTQDTIGSAGASFEADLIDKKFKLPQVLRLNLGTDIKLPDNFNLTIDLLYSQTLNNVLYQDVNLTAPVGVVDPAFNNGFDKRIAFASSSNARRKNPTITNAILVTNTNKGYAFNAGFTLNKTWNNFFAQVAYNYNQAADINSGASSTALSQWEFVQVVGDPNNPGLANSNYMLKHRVSALVTYSISYAKHLKTSLGLFYSGNSGQVFTYLVNGDLNSDGRFGNDLVYVPADPGQITFVDLKNSAGTVLATAAQQSAAFENFINNDSYLSKRRGQYTERNGRSTPWENVIDARLAQDFYIMTGGKRHTLEFTFDVFNLTNLINKKWGRQYSVTNQAYNLLTIPSSAKGYNFTAGSTPWSLNFGSRWQGQFGLRYTFN
jgi:hypothetical protein